MVQGTVLNTVFDRLQNAEKIVEKHADKFAKAKNYGFVTSCPTNLGTGMRASVHIKIPALTKGGSDTEAKKVCKPLGLSVRGLGGEHTPIGEDGTVDISPSARSINLDQAELSSFRLKTPLKVENENNLQFASKKITNQKKIYDSKKERYIQKNKRLSEVSQYDKNVSIVLGQSNGHTNYFRAFVNTVTVPTQGKNRLDALLPYRAKRAIRIYSDAPLVLLSPKKPNYQLSIKSDRKRVTGPEIAPNMADTNEFEISGSMTNLLNHGTSFGSIPNSPKEESKEISDITQEFDSLNTTLNEKEKRLRQDFYYSEGQSKQREPLNSKNIPDPSLLVENKKNALNIEDQSIKETDYYSDFEEDDLLESTNKEKSPGYTDRKTKATIQNTFENEFN
ncbi:hypothetical protein HDV06_004056 [Boothiomyces sp. JEL0866]|nr:hypothetical protein HDV06_004056 [Boothiomyces sp. JEL0866]